MRGGDVLFVILDCADRAIETGLRDRLVAFLPRILAEALSVPGDKLVPEDVIIRYGSGEWVSPRGDDFRVRIETEDRDRLDEDWGAVITLAAIQMRSCLPVGVSGLIEVPVEGELFREASVSTSLR
jgi:hypothetical protein